MLSTAKRGAAKLFQLKNVFLKLFLICGVFFGLTSCNFIPETKFWLKNVNFEVDEKANDGKPITCHIVATYSDDINGILQNMTSKEYFVRSEELVKKYKSNIEIVFNNDLLPGVNKPSNRIKLSSYSKAKGLFIFAKYKIDGKFAEALGVSPAIVVRFLQYSMEVEAENPKNIFAFLAKK